jgi:hypothetical protein
MHYALIIYSTPRDFEAHQHPEDDAYWQPWRAYLNALREAGVMVHGSALQSEAMTTTVRVRGGQRQVQDGPYIEAKEQLGGFAILELPSLDAALDWAARCPAAATSRVEIRPIANTDRAMGITLP